MPPNTPPAPLNPTDYLGPGVSYLPPPSAYSLALSDVVIHFGGSPSPYTWPVDEIVAFIQGVYNAIILFLNDWIVRPIQNIFNWIADRLTDLYRSIVSWIQDALNWLGQNVIAGVGNLLGALGSLIGQILGFLGSLIGNLLGAIGSTIGDLLGNLGRWIGDRLGDLGSTIGTLLGNLGSWIGDRLGDLGKWIGDRLGDLGTWLGRLWSDFWAMVGAQFANLRDWINVMLINVGRLLNAVWTGITGFIQEHIIDPLGDWLSRIWDAITKFWVWLRDGLGRILGQLGTWLSQIWNSDLIRAIVSAAGQLFGWVKDRLSDAAGAIWSIIGSRVPRGPHGAPDAIARTAGVIGTLAWTLAAAKIGGQSILPHITGLDRSITQAVKEVTDYSEVNMRWVRPLMDSFVGQPTYYYFNYLFRNRLPSPSELIGLVGEYQIAPEEYMDHMGYYGIPEEWARNLMTLAYRPMSLSRLMGVTNTVVAADEWFAEELRSSAYRPGTIKTLTAFLRVSRMMEGAGRGTGTLLNLYRDGFYSVEQLRSQLAAMGNHPDVIEGYVMAARWIEQADWHTDVMAAYSDAYAKDLLTEGEYRGRLREQGINQQRLDNIVLRANIRKTPAPLRKRAEPPQPIYLRPEGLIALRSETLKYEEGLIDRGTYITRLESWEMPHALVAANVDLADARRRVDELRGIKPIIPPYETDAGRLTTRTLILLWDKREINDAELSAGLRGLDMPPNLVAAYLANAKARAFQPEDPDELPIPKFVPNSPQAILLSNSRIAYRAAELDANQFGDILIDLGYRPEDARAIIDAENLIRKEPVTIPAPIIPPFEPRSPESIMFSTASTAYRQALMAATDYEAILVKLGYRPEDARLIRQAEDLVRKRTD